MKDHRIAVLSDLHLGHKRNDPQKMVDALDEVLYGPNAVIRRVRVLYLAGDVFEELLELNHPAIPVIDLWIARLLKACVKWNVRLRVLNGTASHDQDQSERFATIRDMLGLDTLDYLYVHDIDVEYMEDLDMRVLYIRDRGETKAAQDTYSDAREVMTSKGVERVDIAIMHGMFEYQMTGGMSAHGTHVQEQYEKIVRSAIFIGHVHTHSNNGKVWAQGSFDRLKHSEEEAKGYLECEFVGGKAHVQFVENLKARHYLNIYAYEMSMEETIAHIDDQVKQLDLDACVCVEAQPNHPLFTNMAEIVRRYPTITWSKRPKDKNTQQSNEVTTQQEVLEWHPVNFAPGNAEDILMTRILKKTLEQSDYEFIRTSIRSMA